MQYIGIVGWSPHMVAAVSKLHLQSGTAELLAIADPSDEAFAYGRDTLGLKHLYRDPAPLYNLHQLNTIIVCSSAEYHLQHITKALQSGTNVIVDLPLASNVADCLAIEQIVRRYPSQQVLLGFPRRFDRSLQQLKSTVSSGALGDIISIQIENYEALPSTFLNQQSEYMDSKGIFMDLTIQDIDLVSWLTGQSFTSVYAAGSAQKYPSLATTDDADTAVSIATLSEGTLVQLLSSRTAAQPDGFTIHLTGTLGHLSYTSRSRRLQASTSQLQQQADIAEPYETKLYQEMLRYYLTETQSGTRLPHTVDIGTLATKVAVAMTKSYVLGEVIKID